VARLLLYNEHWQGAAQEDGAPDAVLAQPPAPQGFGVAAPDMPRASPGQLGGAWNVFSVAAAPVPEEDPLTGEARRAPRRAHCAAVPLGQA
jgi:hypothetical protein